MMYSAPNKPAVFPFYNRFDSPSSDGKAITALAAFQDTILQFKDNAMYVINVSNGGAGAYAEASYRDCGVSNPCQVFTTSFGVIFANKHGCYIYDGNRVTSLTAGKFTNEAWDIPSDEGSVVPANDGAGVPCVGYCPRSQNIIVLKDINHSSTDDGAWVYNMVTQSWTESNDMINNADGTRFSNFIISNLGYLTIVEETDNKLMNYNHDKSVDDGNQTITYITKDMDFGLPSQTKKIFKVYITYFSDDSTVPSLYWGKDGAAPSTSFDQDSDGNSGSFKSSGGLQTTAFWATDADLTGIKSLSLKINGATDHSFEIQDISILYRLRPIK